VEAVENRRTCSFESLNTTGRREKKKFFLLFKRTQ
jgi:hypothetical protein